MLNKLKPTIGIIDSGIGGITVLNQLISKFKCGNYIYFADNLYMPYGNMSELALKARLKQIIKSLSIYNLDFIIIACNTASSVIDLDNTQKLVLMQFDEQKTYIATPLTKKAKPKLNIIECRSLAKQIEENISNKKKINLLIQNYVKKYKLNKLKTFVLGCTHYELVQDVFKKYCPNSKIECNSKAVVDAIDIDFNQKDSTIHFILSKPDFNYYQKLNSLINKQEEE